MDREELNVILENHERWLNYDGGECAGLQYEDLQYASLQDADLRHANLRDVNLQGADLEGADLRRTDLQGVNLRSADLEGASLQYASLQGADLWGADLKGANIDYSAWPLWCGSLGVKVDARIARQLMYHALSVICDDPEFLEIRNDPKMLKFANKFHRVEIRSCPTLEPIEGEKQEDKKWNG